MYINIEMAIDIRHRSNEGHGCRKIKIQRNTSTVNNDEIFEIYKDTHRCA